MLVASGAPSRSDGIDPSCPGAATTGAPPPLLFADDFEVGTPCRWGPTQGWDGSCASCGNCRIDDGEVCDDGNAITETVCPYGTIFCTRCDATCEVVLELIGSFCGDDIYDRQYGESCDDGNMLTESSCPHGNATCDICDAGCSLQARTGPLCGDAAVDPPWETCDDGNVSACGTCGADCRSPRPAEFATGFVVVVPGASLADGETVTLGDGLGTNAVFEFDSNIDWDVAHVRIPFTGTSTAIQVRTQLVAAINDHPTLRVGAQAGSGALILLTHRVRSSLGNVPIQDSVASSGFVVLGLSGGTAGDCLAGVGCVSSNDCASATCVSGACVGP